jgi:hypothetical protein
MKVNRLSEFMDLKKEKNQAVIGILLFGNHQNTIDSDEKTVSDV